MCRLPSGCCNHWLCNKASFLFLTADDFLCRRKTKQGRAAIVPDPPALFLILLLRCCGWLGDHENYDRVACLNSFSYGMGVGGGY